MQPAPLRLGIFAKTFAGSDPATVLAAARDAGYAAVQYNMACSGMPAMPDALAQADIAAIRRASEATGVAIAAVSGTYNMIHPDPAQRAAGLRRLSLLIAHARAMGTGMVTLCTGTRHATDQWAHHPDNATPEAWRDLLAEMAKACEQAESAGIRLGIEPELANVVDSAAAARRLIDSLQSPALAIVLDPANLFETASDADRRAIIADAVDRLADRIVMAHAKDRHPDGSFATAGQGVVDFPHFIACLKAAGFHGDLVTHGLTAPEAPAVAAFLRGLA
ncbi:sugar phosphate isomerase/epimerase family protein [Paragemmobacter straminiformis]|uniref:Sugar phosphate isomerase/epimerase n=1 Tax=Paragemmobacter straminiformis TaxID=2045119 RepID=A0A842I4J6_9RHOB|nr:sugar phosphate isomerase/epimerase [Gemmobacter straminiformis]MBC2834435.1 sugar phosphate isomerase/epimerase [Gemmobacter straminiformis]